LGKPSWRCFFKSLHNLELARDFENTPPTRFASGPAFRALREMKKLPRKHGATPA
jgi:hypothetical protein